MNEQQAPQAAPQAGGGLLARIAARQGQAQQAAQSAQQQGAADAAMPDAVESAAGARASYSGAVAQGPDRELQEEAATPEEQEMFTQAERAMAEIVYGEKASRSIVAAVKGAGDPVDGVGKSAKDLVQAVRSKFPNVTDEVLLGLGESAVEQIVELVEASNPDISLDENQMAEAYSIAVTSWMESNPGSVDGDMMAYMNESAPQQL